MKPFTMKPIHYDLRQAILMFHIASLFRKKKAPLLSFKSFGLQADGKGGWVWNPR